MVDEVPARVGPTFDADRDVVTDAAALQGLAHPLRLRLLGLLRAYGPSTATKLAARCGESSGLTSYHLRQLAEAGFVVDADPADLAGVDRTPRGTARGRAGPRPSVSFQNGESIGPSQPVPAWVGRVGDTDRVPGAGTADPAGSDGSEDGRVWT